MLDPMQRWREYGEKPDYAGPLTFGGVPCTQDPAELAGFDVAIVGAPMDELVSDRPGARFAPRAIRAASCPPGPHLEVGVDAFAALRIVDFCDAAVVPAQPSRSHAAIEQTVGEVVGAGLLPLIIGGDHSITGPDARACAARHGPLGLVHFDTHTDTGVEVFGATLSHGTVMRDDRGRGRDRPAPLRADRVAGVLAGSGRVRLAEPSAGSRACSCTTSANAESTAWCARRFRWSAPGRHS